MKQATVALETGLASAVARPRHTLLIAFGFLIAGITLVILLTIPAGLQRLAGRTGFSDVALVLPNGSFGESSGTLDSSLAPIVGGLPGVAQGQHGQPMVAPQFVVNVQLPRTNHTTATVLLRGVTPLFWQIAGHAIRLQRGTQFQPGHDQLIAGMMAARGFASLAPGDAIKVQNQPWRVTGDFTAGGGFWESELWTDLSTLQSAYHAQGKFTALWVKLKSPAAFKAFKKALHDDPRTSGLYAEQQRTYYADQAGFLTSFIHAATIVVAAALGLGAILAIVNALGMALDARRRDLAVLRAVGFRRSGLAVALLVEVLIIGGVCAGVAVLIAWLTVNGHEVGSSTFTSAIQFRMRVDGSVIGWTVVYLLVIGALSALWPIVRAVRAPLTKALQDE